MFYVGRGNGRDGWQEREFEEYLGSEVDSGEEEGGWGACGGMVCRTGMYMYMNMC